MTSGKLFSALIFILLFAFEVKAQTIAAEPTLKDKYTKRIGNLRLSNSTLAFGNVLTNESKKDTIRMMNIGSKPISFTLPSKNTFSSLTLSSSKLGPQEAGYIIVNYNFGLREDFGFILDRILISTDDADQPQKNINVTATIKEYFAPGDSSLPKARVPETIFNYGTLNAGSKTSHDYKIFNDGTKPLLIRKVKSTCGCIKSTFANAEIKPGESGAIHIEFDSFGKEGKDSRGIYVYINDPMLSEFKLEMNGTVLK